MVGQSQQHSGDVLQMLLQRARVHTGIIDELADIAGVDVLSQDVRHVTLEGGRSLGQSKLHHPELKLTEGSGEGGLVTMFRREGNLPVPPE
eukprot:958361-Rhodomonas_salina.1